MNIKLFFTLGYCEDNLSFGILLAILLAIYVFIKTKRLFNFAGIKSKSKSAIAIRIALALLIVPFCINVWSPAAVLAFYVILTSLCADVLLAIIHLVTKKKFNIFNKFYIHTSLFLVAFVLVFVQGWLTLNTITNTTYQVENRKNNDSLNICFISDLHFGNVQPTDRLAEKIDEISTTNPDVVILGGDITDERDSKEDMEYCYHLLGQIKSKYGTYFVCGNHDKQPCVTDYENDCRAYSDQDLMNAITNNNIHILEDDKTTINNFVLIGRADKGWDLQNERKPLTEILTDEDKSKFIIDIDHQPQDQEEALDAGCSMELSGHTHNGQVFPFNVMTTLARTYCYGEYWVDNMLQIISSGFAGWGWPARNVGVCEYVTINIR